MQSTLIYDAFLSPTKSFHRTDKATLMLALPILEVWNGYVAPRLERGIVVVDQKAMQNENVYW
ncbi:hypothetical protein M514_06786 [Trichuris suis]|uniref:Uncharacterized protein n=1 Tax=Trichuris suis TaxID=68888 RepID=A0A085M5A9_9BILA|nr:hypothetical protein M513_06786 [Trichuris suis]KFD69984.1 hypothetical protein M514_06786 [Trichuris suis]